jgi:hypothetical protein
LSLVKKRHWFWFYWLVYTFGLIIASKPLTMFYIITCFLLYFHLAYVNVIVPVPSALSLVTVNLSCLNPPDVTPEVLVKLVKPLSTI